MTLRDCRPTSQSRRVLRSSGSLRSVECLFRADVSGHPMGTILKGQVIQEVGVTWTA
jgi:hypothetical protein